MTTNKWFKRFFSILCAFSLFAIPIAIAGCSGGCKSTERTAYVGSGVTHISVTAALRSWNDYLGLRDAELTALANTDPAKAAKERQKLGEQNAKIKDAYAKYQAAQLAVLTAAQLFGNLSPDDPNAPAAADRLNASIAASATTMNSVIDLLKQFGVKVK